MTKSPKGGMISLGYDGWLKDGVQKVQLDDKTLALACLFYGCIVIIIGIVSFIVPRKVTDSRIKDSLWLLGVFGLLHGVRAFLQVAELIAPATVAERTLFLLDFVGFG